MFVFINKSFYEVTKMKVKLGNTELTMDSPFLTELKESNDLMGNPQALQKRMEEDGYLFIRGFHQLELVQNARKEILQKIREANRLAPESALDSGIIGADNKAFPIRSTCMDYPALLELVNAPYVMDFFSQFLQGEAITYDTKWGRAVEHGGYTGVHYDIVYMGKGTKNVYTMWSPIGDVPYALGGLTLCLGSHRMDRLRNTYGQSDYEEVEGWLSNDPLEVVQKFGGTWGITDYRAGDAVIFGMYTLHASLTNQTDRYRLSVDTRYQLKSEPIDPRWHGKNIRLAEEDSLVKVKSIAEARKDWGI
jgi:ectoine hydroxylase-related dioxygenase (phytanoyl-CoA dioxygenase family)